MSSEPKVIRSLSPSERVYVEFAKGSAVLGSLELNQRLDIQQAQSSLNQLINRHPLLQATVKQGEQSLSFVQKNNHQVTIELLDSDDFKRVYQDAQNWPVDPRQTLIQCRLALSSSSSYIVFLMHHCIADGACVSAFLNEFLDCYTNQEHSAPYKYTAPDAIEQLCPAPQQPAGVTRQQEQDLVDQLQPIRMPFKPEMELSTPPFMSTLSRCLSVQESAALIQQAKAKGCTVHGVLSAAIVLATKELASQAYQKDDLVITVKYALDIRRRLNAPLPPRQIFAAVTAYNEIYCLNADSLFWPVASNTQQRIHNYLGQDGASRSAHAFSAGKSVENANVSLMISNIGLSGIQAKYNNIEVLDAHVHATVLAPCPVISILTVNAKIHLDFSFTQPFVPEYATTQIADRALDILRTELVL